MARTVLTNGRIWGADRPQTLILEDGRIAEITDAPPAGGADAVEDLGGQIVLPGFVDGHAHLDKSLWGEPWVKRTSLEISMEQMIQDTLDDWRDVETPVGVRAERFLRECIKHGTTTMRTFADVAPEVGLSGVEAMLELKERYADVLDIKVTAFSQTGMLRRPGTTELLEEALRAGVDGIGGLDPAGVDGDAKTHLDTVFGLADKYDAAVDFHIHEDGPLGHWLISQIAERVKTYGKQGRTTLCDVFSLTRPSPEELKRVGGVLADAEIAVVVGVLGILPVPEVQTLRELGVPMCLGSEASRGRWSPWGDGDILNRSSLMSYKLYYRRDVDLEFALHMATDWGREALGAEPCALRVGDPADLVVLPGQALAELVVLPPRRSLVVKGGRVVVRDGEIVARV